MSKIKIHTIDQPESEITTYVLSCNRLHLLEKTMESFLRTRDIITKIVIVDDSAADGVFEKLVEKYGEIADIICFPENRGLWWAQDFMTSFCSTKYIFYLEEDWYFIDIGYLSLSKDILEKYRDIGSVDISWRTFQEECIDSYEDKLIDNAFYYKKPWRITKNHFHWFIWQGSPNLKRREDLILLGRVEKYYNEWNIDRKFFGLGFKGVYLNKKCVIHTGDNESIMVNKRPNEIATPETLFPKELSNNRTLPWVDYYKYDELALQIRNTDKDHTEYENVLVTALIDINRDKVDNRSFEDHYINGLQKLLDANVPLVIFADDKYYEKISAMAGGKKAIVHFRSLQDIRRMYYHDKIVEITNTKEWKTQSNWMWQSIITNPDYISLTLHKVEFLKSAAYNSKYCFQGKRYFWIDSGICNSYNINYIKNVDFNKIKTDNIFITSYPYPLYTEIHGFSKNGYKKLCQSEPLKVPRATIFGGDLNAINELNVYFYNFLDKALSLGYIGTEEAIFAGIYKNKPEIFDIYHMPNGDINNYLSTIRNNGV